MHLAKTGSILFLSVVCNLVVCDRAGAQAVLSWGRLSGDSDLAGRRYVGFAAGATQTVALRSDGTAVSWGGYFGGPPALPTGTTYVLVAAGGCSLALRSDGVI